MYQAKKNIEQPVPGLIGSFGALNRGLSIAENEFSDMENLSSDAFPLIGTRERRTRVRHLGKVRISGKAGAITSLRHKTEGYTLGKKQFRFIENVTQGTDLTTVLPENPKLGDRYAVITEETVNPGTDSEYTQETPERVYQWGEEPHYSLLEVPTNKWEASDSVTVRLRIGTKLKTLSKMSGTVSSGGKTVSFRFIEANDTAAVAAAKQEKLDYIITYTEGQTGAFSFFKKGDPDYTDAAADFDLLHDRGVVYNGTEFKLSDVSEWSLHGAGTTKPPAGAGYKYYIKTNENGVPTKFFENGATMVAGWLVISGDPKEDFDIVRKKDGSFCVPYNSPTSFSCNGVIAFSTVRYDGAKRLYLDGLEDGDGSAERQFTIGDVTEDALRDATADEDGITGLSAAEITKLVNEDKQNRRKLVTMGARVIVFPEMYYANIYDEKDRGFLYCKRYPVWKEGYSTSQKIRISPCSYDGTTMTAKTMGKTAPEDPENGEIWLDISQPVSDYKKYDANTNSWNSIATTYLKIECKGAFKGFRQWDSIFIDGFDPGAARRINKTDFNMELFEGDETTDEKYVADYEEFIENRIMQLGKSYVKLFGKVVDLDKAKVIEEYNGEIPKNENLLSQIKDLNGKYYTLFQCTDNYIVIAGLLDATVTFEHIELESKANQGTVAKEYGRFTFERRVPMMDYWFECGNRLWGARFGLDEDGNTVNEIRACKAGDPTNWNSFLGISEDSYQLTVGSDGEFTGAINFNGYPTFFKQKYIHKIFGSTPTTFQLQTSSLRGVGRGMSESMTICANRLYYATENEIVLYDGASVYTISAPLGKLSFDSVISGTDQKKIYFVLRKTKTDSYVKSGTWTEQTGYSLIDFLPVETEEKREMYVYDTELDLWHREDCPDILFFANDGPVLYYIGRWYDEAGECYRYEIKSVNERVNHIFLQKNWMHDVYPKKDDPVSWWAETGDIGFGDPYGKYLQKISVRAKVEEDAEYHIEIAYDGGEFEQITETNTSEGIRARDYVFRIRRCDYFRLRFSGVGQVTFISIYKLYVQGSDKK